MGWLVGGILLALTASTLLAYFKLVRPRGYERWLVPYVLESGRRRPPEAAADMHVLLCIADHFEPKAQHADKSAGRARVDHWLREFPRQFANFRDSSGRPPRHSFFFPIEEYEPEYLDALAHLCGQGFGEVEVHLHHDHDTAEDLREKLAAFRDLLAERHGLLARHKDTGELGYAFIHGNWALCNSRPDGRCCGVNNELDVLRQTGCFADFTYPSAPSPTQPATINSIYYASNQPGRPRSADRGLAIGSAGVPPDSLLLIQGPLLLDWSRRKWGLVPRLENGCLQASQPPSLRRMDAWLRARVQVPTRPDWFFVKLHAHGAPENAHDVLLGEPMVRFHEGLARRSQQDPHFHYHYVTAREMYNLAKAAEAGYRGPVGGALDFVYMPMTCSSGRERTKSASFLGTLPTGRELSSEAAAATTSPKTR
jgi:hypothetical protein